MKLTTHLHPAPGLRVGGAKTSKGLHGVMPSLTRATLSYGSLQLYYMDFSLTHYSACFAQKYTVPFREVGLKRIKVNEGL
jgi:hypothetical protein